MSPLCAYCLRGVATYEPGAAYWVVEATEALIWAHVECIEMYEGVGLYDLSYRF